ncbi:MAG: PLP-dependent transferase, partial [Pseudomonadota bacterium]
VVQLLRDLSIFTVAESLGGFESLVCIPATMTHASMPPEARAIAGISETLVRFSIGLEHAEDLSADLLAALDRQAPKQKVAPRSVASFPSQVAASI